MIKRNLYQDNILLSNKEYSNVRVEFIDQVYEFIRMSANSDYALNYVTRTSYKYQNSLHFLPKK